MQQASAQILKLHFGVLRADLQTSLPSIEQLERELAGTDESMEEDAND